MASLTIGTATLYHADCFDVLPSLRGVDHVITDPPYSARTHAGHDAACTDDGDMRTKLSYAHFGTSDVNRLTMHLNQICDGWIVWMCDHILAPDVQGAMEFYKRYTFAPLAYFAPGSRVRLSGDGPSSWTIWIIVSRTKKQARWGTLPGGYLHQSGWGNREYIGGKPVGLMKALVNDYSRVGETVLDPCMGAGTTGIACMDLGRRFIGIEKDRTAFDLACERLEKHWAQGDLFRQHDAQEQTEIDA